MPALPLLAGCSILAAVAYLAVIVGATVVPALRHGARRDDPVDNHDALSVSRFTMPVSIIVPADRSAPPPSATLAALLALNYPELEVIVVATGLAGSSWEGLKRDWRLEAREYFYRRTLATSEVRKIYRSARDWRLVVVDKAPGARADAMNCGVNLARFRFVTTVAPDILFNPDALLRAMSGPLRDPAAVIAAASHVEVRSEADWLASMRSLMETRIAWRTAAKAFGPHAGVVVWRRDAVVQAGGFSTSAGDPDVEMMIRLQAQGAGQVIRTPEIFGRVTLGTTGARLREAFRRQLAALEALAGRGAGAGWREMAIQVSCSEVITPLAQAWVFAATLAGAAFGWWSWTAPLAAFVLLALGNALVSAVALLVRGAALDAPDAHEVSRMLRRTLGDFALRAPVAAAGRAAAFWTFASTSAAHQITPTRNQRRLE